MQQFSEKISLPANFDQISSLQVANPFDGRATLYEKDNTNMYSDNIYDQDYAWMHTQKTLLRRIHYAHDQRLAGAAIQRLNFEFTV